MSQTSKEAKYQYKVNTNLSHGFLKGKVVNLFFSKTDMQDIILELKNLVPIRPNRNEHRNIGKYHRRERSKVAENQKEAI